MDVFNTAFLIAVVEDLKLPQSWLLDRYFPTVVQSDTEEIKFDVKGGKRRIAPFVSPLLEGKLVESLGYTTKTFKPAYIKDKRVFDSEQPLKRAAGTTGLATPIRNDRPIWMMLSLQASNPSPCEKGSE
jgi:hypothetical protein